MEVVNRNAKLELAERAGAENMAFRLRIAEALAKEANITLTILLASMAGTITYLLKYIEPPNRSLELAVGAGTVLIWLIMLAGLLLHKCIKTSEIYPPANEPENLYRAYYTIEVIREVELEGLQKRILHTAERNRRVATWLDRVRYGLFLSPLLFAIGAGCSWALRHDLFVRVWAAE